MPAKVFRSTDVSKASLKIEDEAISIIGDSRHFVTADTRGVTVRGPVSMVNDGLDRRRAGIFVEMSDIVRMIPSTIITPLPPTFPSPPTFALINIARDVAFFAALLA